MNTSGDAAIYTMGKSFTLLKCKQLVICINTYVTIIRLDTRLFKQTLPQMNLYMYLVVKSVSQIMLNFRLGFTFILLC